MSMQPNPPSPSLDPNSGVSPDALQAAVDAAAPDMALFGKVDPTAKLMSVDIARDIVIRREDGTFEAPAVAYYTSRATKGASVRARVEFQLVNGAVQIDRISLASES